MEIKACSFFGHRKIEITEDLIQKLTQTVENLIVHNNVSTFLFGSKSQFNDLCLQVVTSLKEKYPFIKRVAYTCKSEGHYLEKDRKKWEDFYKRIYKTTEKILCVEEEFEHKTKYTSGKASYIERNCAMINNSDYCIFFYNKNYKPPMRSLSKNSCCNYQPKSGTAIAYNYALKKNKAIFNLSI